MKQLICAGAVLLLTGGCSLLFPEEKCKTAVAPLSHEAGEYTLSNQFLAVKCIPKATGILSGLEALPEKRPLMKPVKYTLREDDLLPPRASVSVSGIRELFTGMDLKTQSTFAVTRFEKLKNGGAELVLANPNYRNADAGAVKTFTLRPGESRVHIRLELSWRDPKPQKLAFWINGIAEMGKGRDTVLLPVKGQTKSRGKRGLVLFPKDGVYADKFLEPQQLFAAPCRPWMGRVSPEKPGLLVLKISDDFTRDGCFLAWKHGVSPLHTTELIGGETEMKRGKTMLIDYELLYFPGMTSLRDAAGPYAIDCKGDKLLLASAVSCSSGKLKLLLEDPAGKIRELGVLKFPKLQPGKIAELSLKEKLPATPGILLLQMPDGVTLRLLPQVQIVKEGK